MSFQLRIFFVDLIGYALEHDLALMPATRRVPGVHFPRLFYDGPLNCPSGHCGGHSVPDGNGLHEWRLNREEIRFVGLEDEPAETPIFFPPNQELPNPIDKSFKWVTPMSELVPERPLAADFRDRVVARMKLRGLTLKTDRFVMRKKRIHAYDFARSNIRTRSMVNLVTAGATVEADELQVGAYAYDENLTRTMTLVPDDGVIELVFGNMGIESDCDLEEMDPLADFVYFYDLLETSPITPPSNCDDLVTKDVKKAIPRVTSVSKENGTHGSRINAETFTGIMLKLENSEYRAFALQNPLTNPEACPHARYG